MKNLLMKVVRAEVGMQHLARLRGRCYPATRAHPLALRVLAVPIRVSLRTSGLSPRDWLATAMAATTVEVVRTAARCTFERGLHLDLRRFWGK